MKRTTVIGGWVLYGLGAILWIVAYFIQGHHALLDWPAFSPSWISMFVPNVEAEIGLVLTLFGMTAIYGPKLLDRYRTSESA